MPVSQLCGCPEAGAETAQFVYVPHPPSACLVGGEAAPGPSGCSSAQNSLPFTTAFPHSPLVPRRPPGGGGPQEWGPQAHRVSLPGSESTGMDLAASLLSFLAPRPPCALLASALQSLSQKLRSNHQHRQGRFFQEEVFTQLDPAMLGHSVCDSRNF